MDMDYAAIEEQILGGTTARRGNAVFVRGEGCWLFEAAGLEFGRATRRGLDAQLTVVPVGLVKGLEVDAAVVVEPGRIISEEAQGMRALYVALTRATRRLSVVHAEPLPAVLQE